LSAVTIDQVTLTVLPANNVESGTDVILRCETSVSQSLPQPLTYSFRLLQDDQVMYSKNISASVMERSLSSARVSNSGRYQCSVHIYDKHKTSNILSLSVTGLQIPMLNVKSDIMSEGEDIIATCSAPEETGSLIFNFYENDLDVKRVISSSNSVTTTLTTQKLTEIYLQCAYMVIMHPNAGLSNKSNMVKVIVRDLDAITPQISFSPKGNVVEGDRVQITCKVQYPPDIELYLTKGNTVLHESHTTFTKSLVVRAEDSGDYVCKAEKGSVQKKAVFPLHVAELFSKPILRMSPDQVFEGERFTLTCSSNVISSVKIGIADIKYVLLKDGRRISAVAKYEDTASPATNGQYYCMAMAKEVNKTSSPHDVKAKGDEFMLLSKLLPVSRPVLEPKEVTVSEGSDLILICRVQQGTYPITFTWYHNRVMLLSSIQEVRSLEGRHVVKVIERDQRGDYYCEASNYASETKKSYPVRIGVSLALWKKVLIGVFCILLLVAIVLVLTVFFKKMSHPRRKKQATELSVKPSRPKSGDPMRISLTLDIEDNTAINGTPCVMGRNVWSENVSGSGTDFKQNYASEIFNADVSKMFPYLEVPVTKSIEPEYSVQHTEVQVSTPGELRSLNHATLPFEHDHNRQ
uniref:Platelet/endothelial cell adhesion molecule 1 n=1 Tax=Sinocyclocheilus anshuiensis TaxID=1608454 RepID=A0A671K5A0_9TELE